MMHAGQTSHAHMVEEHRRNFRISLALTIAGLFGELALEAKLSHSERRAHAP